MNYFNLFFYYCSLFNSIIISLVVCLVVVVVDVAGSCSCVADV